MDANLGVLRCNHSVSCYLAQEAQDGEGPMSDRDEECVARSVAHEVCWGRVEVSLSLHNIKTAAFCISMLSSGIHLSGSGKGAQLCC
jgi:hypothetical protein